MTRDTSIEAYHTIVENGLLSTIRMQVYKYMFSNGPKTAREMTKDMLKQGENSGNLATRLSELRKIGVVKEVGKKLDEETGKTVLVWDVTNKLPTKLEKKTKIKCVHCEGKGYHYEN